MDSTETSHNHCNFNRWPTIWSRRKFLQTTGAGFASLAMHYLFACDGLLAAEPAL